MTLSPLLSPPLGSIPDLRVALADDSTFIRKAVARMLTQEPGVELVGTATCGEELLENLALWRPDVVILDLSMPGMGGLPTLDGIMARQPVPVIILSTHSKKDAPQTIEALHRGAVDFIDKQQYSLVDFDALRQILLEKIRLAVGAVAPPASPILPVLQEPPPPSTAAPPPILLAFPFPVPCEIVLIGASTGGPPAIEQILQDLGPSIPVPIVVAQHMPAGFTRAFAERLNAYLPLQVREATDAEPLLPGTVYIAPGGIHLRISREGREGREPHGGLRAVLSRSPEGVLHRPSVDLLFLSGAAVTMHRTLALLLTGMGYDGAQGMVRLVEVGAHTLAQDEGTSVVWGMPRAALNAGGVCETLPLAQIGARLRELILSEAKAKVREREPPKRGGGGRSPGSTRSGRAF